MAGRFRRDGRDICILVNVAATPYTGALTIGADSQRLILHPEDGRVERASADASGKMAVTIPPRSAILLVAR